MLDCTVQQEAVLVGAYGYILNVTADTATIDDMAAVSAEYPGISNIGAIGTVGNAFGIYAEEPAKTSGSAVTAAVVADGDIAMASGSKFYLDATPNWRSSSAMNKGGKSIYINSSGKLVYHDGTTEKEIAFV